MTSVKTMTTVAGLLAVGTIAIVVPARADMKVVQTTTIDNPQITAMMQSMSAQQKANLVKAGLSFMTGAPLVTTSYVSGKKVRSDIGPRTIILDSITHKMTVINRSASTYSTQIYDQPSLGRGAMNITVRDTGQLKTILGHVTHRYTLSGNNPAMGQRISGDLWAAPDLPQPPQTPLSSGPMANLQAAMHKIKGIPLLMSLSITGGPAGNTNVRSSVKSVSMAPIPAALFAIPRGYKQAASGQGFGPMGGLPMGR